MLERFTDRARRVMVEAQEEARTLGRDCVDTEHLLLALVRESEGAAAQVLESLAVDPEAVRQRVLESAGPGARTSSGQLPFAPRAKEALRLAVRESVQFGHRYIGTEHLLLGLLREGDGAAARVLTSLGANLDEARERVTQVLDEQRRKRWPRVLLRRLPGASAWSPRPARRRR
jgi:ATP-dependent Clp protease ATP-binding subunit ClpC